MPYRIFIARSNTVDNISVLAGRIEHLRPLSTTEDASCVNNATLAVEATPAEAVAVAVEGR